jgi:hypothetical protein
MIYGLPRVILYPGFSRLDTGERKRRFMKGRIRYTDEPVGELKRVKDFLPSPVQLILKEEKIKVTISLSRESVDFLSGRRQNSARRIRK